MVGQWRYSAAIQADERGWQAKGKRFSGRVGTWAEDLWGLVVGQCDAIDKFRDQNKGYFKRLDPVTSARMLVQMQIDATPDSVGPPIDIIRLTPNSTEWIQKKPECKPTANPLFGFRLTYISLVQLPLPRLRPLKLAW